MKSEIRKSYFLNKYVIITPGRQARPRDIAEETVLRPEGEKECPFCPGKIEKETVLAEIKERGRWQVKSIKNIFPAVSLDNPRAYGAQEVIIETPLHGRELSSLSARQIELVLKMYGLRTKALARQKRLDYILCFKNEGARAGASLRHAHSQIFATEFLPPEVAEEFGAAREYQKLHQVCPYCEIIKREMKSPRRIFADKYIAAFAPYASEYHYEAWIFTKRHLDNITRLNEKEFKSFARVLKLILGKLDKLNLSFNYFLHQVISEKDQHFYLKIQPRENVWGGVELGSGLVINSVAPEAAAEYYRK